MLFMLHIRMFLVIVLNTQHGENVYIHVQSYSHYSGVSQKYHTTIIVYDPCVTLTLIVIHLYVVCGFSLQLV